MNDPIRSNRESGRGRGKENKSEEEREIRTINRDIGEQQYRELDELAGKICCIPG